MLWAIPSYTAIQVTLLPSTIFPKNRSRLRHDPDIVYKIVLRTYHTKAATRCRLIEILRAQLLSVLYPSDTTNCVILHTRCN
ncbi:hypothetical protein TNIN_206531 [Trichonephila inaurata madagascariensis]|uniref:Uncharacterized protein n=1 Tax=Trichonephila inaurata madagascariensis TaxID=2747483 RepID=A0A8X6XXZ8_9ARAC|nr:hypothetical protein TNIN_206531 [Trichonephila inaurata madagascariensis]